MGTRRRLSGRIALVCGDPLAFVFRVSILFVLLSFAVKMERRVMGFNRQYPSSSYMSVLAYGSVSQSIP